MGLISRVSSRTYRNMLIRSFHSISSKKLLLQQHAIPLTHIHNRKSSSNKNSSASPKSSKYQNTKTSVTNEYYKGTKWYPYSSISSTANENHDQKIIHIKNIADFQHHAIQGSRDNRLILVHFYNDWCESCQPATENLLSLAPEKSEI